MLVYNGSREFCHLRFLRNFRASLNSFFFKTPLGDCLSVQKFLLFFCFCLFIYFLFIYLFIYLFCLRSLFKFFIKYVHLINFICFLAFLWWKIISWPWKTLLQHHAIWWERFNQNMWDYFLKVFRVHLRWDSKLSHKNYPTLSLNLNGSQA